MIRKSGHRFSEKIMRKKGISLDPFRGEIALLISSSTFDGAGFDISHTYSAQPPAQGMAREAADLRRYRHDPEHPNRADHGPFRTRLDHCRSRAWADRPHLGACDDHGDSGHALRAAGAHRRQRALACQGADGHRRSRHQFSDDLQPHRCRKSRAQPALSAEGRPLLGPLPRPLSAGASRWATTWPQPTRT